MTLPKSLSTIDSKSFTRAFPELEPIEVPVGSGKADATSDETDAKKEEAADSPGRVGSVIVGSEIGGRVKSLATILFTGVFSGGAARAVTEGEFSTLITFWSKVEVFN